MFIDENCLANYLRIAAEMASPIPVAQDRIRRGVGTMLVHTMEKSTEVRLNACDSKVISRRFVKPDRRWIFASIQASRVHSVRCQAGKSGCLVAHVDIIRIGLIG